MGKCFTTIVGQSVWRRYCYWLSCLKYTAPDKVRGRIARAENNLLHNVNAPVCFTTECKLHANAYCQQSLLKTWKVINADKRSASLALEPRFVPFWWWTGSAELSVSNSLLHSCGPDEINPGNFVCLIAPREADSEGKGPLCQRLGHSESKIWYNRRLKMFCGWCSLYRMYTFTQDAFNSPWKR